MEEIYLIGKLYDDFSNRGFYVLSVATTEAKARTLKHYYEDILFADDDDEITEKIEKCRFGIEIRAFQTDVAEPIGEIITHDCTYEDVKFKRQETLPYRVIK